MDAITLEMIAAEAVRNLKTAEDDVAECTLRMARAARATNEAIARILAQVRMDYPGFAELYAGPRA